MCVACVCFQELEKNMELSAGSFQRQLASERKKTHDALQETQILREEMDKLSAKLKVVKKLKLQKSNIFSIHAKTFMRVDILFIRFGL